MVRMNKPKRLAHLIKIGFGVVLLTALTGCIGWVGGGGDYYDDGGVYYGGGGWWGGGGGYDRGRDVHAYSVRGGASRAAAHGGGGGHGGGGKR